MRQSQWQHATVENELGTVSFECQRMKLIECQSDGFGGYLVMVGNIIFADGRAFGVKMIGTRLETEYDAIVFGGLFSDFLEGFLHFSGKVCLFAGDDSEVGHFIHVGLAPGEQAAEQP